MKSLLTIREFCQEFSVSRSLAYRLFRDKALRPVKIGRLTRVRREDAEAWARRLDTFTPN